MIKDRKPTRDKRAKEKSRFPRDSGGGQSGEGGRGDALA